MVPDDVAEQAKELISEFIVNTEPGDIEPSSEYTLRDKIRLVVECLLFTWFMPGKRWHRNKAEEE
jgi:hypothetical protein